MPEYNSDRRKFVKFSAAGIGGLVLSPFAGTPKEHPLPFPAENPADRKLRILCVGAHPGDPEFGCGGTLARYSDAGHQVSVLYLTRGEAGDPDKTYEESAALRTQEAEAGRKRMRQKQTPGGVQNVVTRLACQGKDKRRDPHGTGTADWRQDKIFFAWERTRVSGRQGGLIGHSSIKNAHALQAVGPRQQVVFAKAGLLLERQSGFIIDQGNLIVVAKMPIPHVVRRGCRLDRKTPQ